MIYVLLGFIVIIKATAYAYEYGIVYEISENYYRESNFYRNNALIFDHDDEYNFISITPGLIFSAGNRLGGYFLADLSWFHYFDAKDNSDDIDINLIEAYLHLTLVKTSIQVGQKSFLFGRGLIMDSDEPGVLLEFQPISRFYCSLESCKVWELSPIASILLSYQLDFLEKVELFGVFCHDADDGFAKMMNWINPSLLGNYFIDNIAGSSGDLFWYGLNAELFIWNIYTSGIAIIQKGRETVTISYPFREERVDFSINSYMIDMGIDYNLTDQISAGIFSIMSRGDMEPVRGEFSAFFSPLPNNTRMAIFFQGFGNQMPLDAFSLGGITLAGIIASGLRIDYQPIDEILVEMNTGLLFPEEKPSRSRNYYGWETDLSLSYVICDRCKLTIEADFFKYGNYFVLPQRDYPNWASRFMFCLNASY
ncbi:MAG: hypothetical protein SVZ03_11450 [Spirochaetota bacterium]|nr:hypothetical protein [Spirochaetota bacterium]